MPSPQKSQLCEMDDRSLELLQGGDGHMWKGFYSRENIQAALRHTYLPTELVEVSADLHTFVLVYRHGFTHLNGCYCVFKKVPKIKLISYAWGKFSFQKKLPMHVVMNNQWVRFSRKTSSSVLLCDFTPALCICVHLAYTIANINALYLYCLCPCTVWLELPCMDIMQQPLAHRKQN